MFKALNFFIKEKIVKREPQLTKGFPFYGKSNLFIFFFGRRTWAEAFPPANAFAVFVPVVIFAAFLFRPSVDAVASASVCVSKGKKTIRESLLGFPLWHLWLWFPLSRLQCSLGKRDSFLCSRSRGKKREKKINWSKIKRLDVNEIIKPRSKDFLLIRWSEGRWTMPRPCSVTRVFLRQWRRLD